MILNSAPQNEAILSNVGEMGEFRIRNSAKAFSILSSGLYANKIRAVIRELSCNAVDSHVAAGKKETPFDVHLPSHLEPWFTIRDYGTGLSHDQVTSIYTTYFESTKTESNDYVGALGLGSKSPFSYTDNFTVTAIKDGRKGIYTAFINDSGVPSIALMSEEQTVDPSGVEVKFSVNEVQDFIKFRSEASYVFSYFTLQPVVGGVYDFKIDERLYETRDIIPGVHHISRSSRSTGTKAIMGNIPYPIDVPNREQNMGPLAFLLGCSLELNFDIGELDFQASREGLSYIPQTIEAIKHKLSAVNMRLDEYVAEEANKITDVWERATFLLEKSSAKLWQSSVNRYVKDTAFPLLIEYGSGVRWATPNLTVEDLAKTYNIEIYALSGTGKGMHEINSSRGYHPADANGDRATFQYWALTLDEGLRVVINDTNIGAGARIKHHYRSDGPNNKLTRYQKLYVVNPTDRTKPMKVEEFLLSIHSPPNVIKVSSMDKKERAKGSSISAPILKLGRRDEAPSWKHNRYDGGDEPVWRPDGDVSEFDATKTYYYLPLSGYVVNSKFGTCDVKSLMSRLKGCGVASLQNIDVYGVRKTDIEFIIAQKNWVNLEDYIAQTLPTVSMKFILGLVMQDLDSYPNALYNSNIVKRVVDEKSPYLVLANKLNGITKSGHNKHDWYHLCCQYAAGRTTDVMMLAKTYVNECQAVYEKYPLMKSLAKNVSSKDLADYINLIDQTVSKKEGI